MAPEAQQQKMRSVAVLDGNILTPLGNLQATWQHLLQGTSAIKRQNFANLQEAWPLALLQELPGKHGSWYRLQAMFEALFIDLPPLPAHTRLFCATSKAAVDELLLSQENVQGQPWQIAEYLAQRLAIAQAAEMVSAACASGLIAMIQGAMNIAAGRCDYALIVGFDMVEEFVLTGFSSLKALAPGGCKPFDVQRQGLSLGEGGGWILLSAQDTVPQTQTMIASLESWAISCDASHITAPCRQASGLIAALKRVQQTADLPIGGINAHGTGTLHNDAMELVAFQQQCRPGTPVCSSKGALGHSLAATGLIEILLSTKSLQDNVLPPTIGLEKAEKTDMLLSGTEAIPLLAPTIMSCNSGFGGINAALLLADQRGTKK